MARGFIGGALWGGVLSLAVATVASVLAPPPNPPQVDTEAPQTVVAPTVPDTPSAAPAAPQTDRPVETAQSAPQTTAPDPESPAPADEIARAPVATPQTSTVPGLDAPDSLPQAGGLAVEGDDPVLPNPQALAPMLPQPADSVEIDTATAPLPAPQPETPEAAPQAEVAPEENLEIAGAEDTRPETGEAETRVPQAEETTDATPEVDSTADAPSETATPAPQPPATEEQQVETAEDAPQPAPAEAPQERAESAPAQPPAAPDTAEAAPEQDEDRPQVAMIAPSTRPQIGTPGITLTDRNNGVVINRLGTSAQGTETQPVTIITEEGATDPSADARPVARYAEPFSNPEDKPLMSIVLIDDGSGPTTGRAGLAALQNFPNAITFAVDTNLPDAEERMALYRAEGFEVLAMIDLPAGAQATDVETTLGVRLAQLDEVVGVLEGTETGLQGSRSVADQVTAILAETGHGLVTQDRGLNTMPKLARKEGVPATPIFRDFDSKGQTATVIRRFLDQAAFKAGQEGAVIMLGRLRPDTISALLLWGLQDRAGSVALAPISAVLTREDAS